jgi:hypothetical protein
MPHLLIVLGAVLVLAGLAGIAAGAPSWALGLGLGSTLIQSGTISFVGGLILFGIALVLRALQDLLNRIEMLAPMIGGRAPMGASSPADFSMPAATSASSSHVGRSIPGKDQILSRRESPHPQLDERRRERVAMADPYVSGTTPRSRPSEPSFIAEKNPSGAAVVRSGIIGGMAYTLYADGSIEAELPIGTVCFGSLAELQEHVTRTGAEADIEFSGPAQ